MTVGTCHLPQFIQVTDNRGTSAITLQVRRRRPAKWLAQRGASRTIGQRRSATKPVKAIRIMSVNRKAHLKGLHKCNFESAPC